MNAHIFHIGTLASKSWFGVSTLVAWAIAMATPAVAAPKLQVDRPLFDFGTVAEGTIVESTFTLRNIGDSPLEVQRIQPACGCTVADVQQLTIPVGETTELRVKFDTSGFAGEKIKTVRLYTNDLRENTTVVSLRGTVKTEVQVEPVRVFFGDTKRGEAPTKSFTVTTDASSGIEISRISSRSANMVLTEEDLHQGTRRGKRVHVQLKPDIPIGNFRGRIVIKTSSKREPVINVNVFAKVTGDIEVTPPEASFGLVETPANGPRIQTIQLRNRSTTPIGIKSVEHENPRLSTRLRTVTPGSLYEVEIALLPDVAGVIRSRVKVMTDHPDREQQLIEIPVYAVINRKAE